MYITDRKNASGVQPSRFRFLFYLPLYGFFFLDFLFSCHHWAVTFPGFIYPVTKKTWLDGRAGDCRRRDQEMEERHAWPSAWVQDGEG